MFFDTLVTIGNGNGNGIASPISDQAGQQLAQVISLSDLSIWVASSGAIAGALSVAILQLIWQMWARLKPLDVIKSNVKRGLSLVVPFLLALLWYVLATAFGKDQLNPDRLLIWLGVGTVGATGKQIGWFLYTLLRGQSPTVGEETLTWATLLSLVKSANPAQVLSNLPAVIAALFPPVTSPPPQDSQWVATPPPPAPVTPPTSTTTTITPSSTIQQTNVNARKIPLE